MREPKHISDMESLAVLAEPPEEAPPACQNTGWSPSLNPTQQQIFDDPTKFILAYGERGSGKTIGAIHKAVRHCFENYNALVLMVVGVKRQATEGGMWYKLIHDVLPQWKAGLGISYTESKSTEVKDQFLFVSNMFGGWSKLLLVSMPVANFVADRAKGIEPSMIVVDELQTLESDTYFSTLVQQLGRRPGIQGPQQYIGCCNPDGPSHWVYKRWWEKAVGENGRMLPAYSKYHVPISENVNNLPEGYYENVLEAVKDDPVEYKRMVLGEWVDRPSGDAIFLGYWNPAYHVRGSVEENKRLLPDPRWPIIIGYDLGSANSAIIFKQNIPTKDKIIWTVFDEIVYIEQKLAYNLLVPELMRRMHFWNVVSESTFHFEHISDNSAFNQFRPTSGDFDALQVEQLYHDNRKYFDGLPKMTMLPCPKPPHSVAARVRMVQTMLAQDRILVSAHCKAVKDMFMHLESEKEKEFRYDAMRPLTPKRSRHVHVFDALTYPMFYYETDSSRQAVKTGTVKRSTFSKAGVL